MEFNEKLQELRKQKNLTQEELAKQLFVSRTAISKWESNRGYPSIDSLKALAKYFDISIDELLSSDELIKLAQDDNHHNLQHLKDLIYGLLDCSVIIFLFLPFFGERGGGLIKEVSLLALNNISSYIKTIYLLITFVTISWGVLELAMQNYQGRIWLRDKQKISLGLSIAMMLVFMLSLQPYAAIDIFIILVIKVILLLKKD